MADKRVGGLTRRPDFGMTAEDRLLGAPGAQEAHGAGEAQGASLLAGREPAPRRRPLKVDATLADQLRDAVLFLRGRGRPELTQNELLDEIIAKGLERLRQDLNGGADIPRLADRSRRT